MVTLRELLDLNDADAFLEGVQGNAASPTASGPTWPTRYRGAPLSTGVGLLFQCFQANLDQFTIQQEGSDDNDFFPGDVGPTP